MLRYPVAYQKTFGKTGDPVEYTQEPFTRGSSAGKRIITATRLNSYEIFDRDPVRGVARGKCMWKQVR